MSEKKWNLITGQNAPPWASALMVAFYVGAVYVANLRDSHFMIGFGCCGVMHNLNNLFKKK